MCVVDVCVWLMCMCVCNVSVGDVSVSVCGWCVQCECMGDVCVV